MADTDLQISISADGSAAVGPLNEVSKAADSVAGSGAKIGSAFSSGRLVRGGARMLSGQLGQLSGMSKLAMEGEMALEGATEALSTVFGVAAGPIGIVLAAIAAGVVLYEKFHKSTDDLIAANNKKVAADQKSAEATQTLNDKLNALKTHYGSLPGPLQAVSKASTALAAAQQDVLKADLATKMGLLKQKLADLQAPQSETSKAWQALKTDGLTLGIMTEELGKYLVGVWDDFKTGVAAMADLIPGFTKMESVVGELVSAYDKLTGASAHTVAGDKAMAIEAKATAQSQLAQKEAILKVKLAMAETADESGNLSKGIVADTNQEIAAMQKGEKAQDKLGAAATKSGNAQAKAAQKAAQAQATATKQIAAGVASLANMTKQYQQQDLVETGQTYKAKLAAAADWKQKQTQTIMSAYQKDLAEAQKYNQSTAQLEQQKNMALDALDKTYQDKIKQDQTQQVSMSKQMDTALTQASSQMYNTMSTDAGKSLATMVEGGKKMTLNMKAEFKNMETAFIEYVAKMIAKWLEFEALKAAGSVATGGIGGMMGFATGTDMLVDRPTMFMAGEGGSPERVSVTPQTGSSGGGSGGGMSIGAINVSISTGASDPKEIADQIGEQIVNAIKGRAQLNFTGASIY